MPEETKTPKKTRVGVPSLIELSSNDPVTTRRFLESVFGWSFVPPPDSADNELPFRTPEGSEGFLHAARSYEPSTRIHRVRVSDLGSTLERVQRAGATLLMPRVDAPGLGSFFTVEIPGGTLLTCWQSAPPSRSRNR
jgi:predicted enzyme related to lactoylglutathione lyase